MCRFCGSQLGPKFGMRPVAEKDLYLRLASAVFTKKHLHPSVEVEPILWLQLKPSKLLKDTFLFISALN